MYRLGALLGLLWLSLTVLGCNRATPAVAPLADPEVTVSHPVVKEITDYEIFTGRTVAIASVDVRARVTGYLDKVLFKEGAEVQEGDPLFDIDPRSYQAALDQAEASLLQQQAHLERVEATFRRATALIPQKAISQDDYDTAKGDRDETLATVRLAKATRDLAKLNLSYCHVAAPISGRTSRQMIDAGNLVQAETSAPTILTTIVTLDPIYAFFSMDDRTMLRVRRLVRDGKIKSMRAAEVPVYLGLVDEGDEFPHQGVINFVDNRLDANSGTLDFRAVFPNSKRILSPNLFVRIRFPIGEPHSAILVSEQAMGSDQGKKFVYVVNGQNEVVYRPIKVGKLQDGLRVVEEGLTVEDRVVVVGLQRIRPGIKVTTKELETPAQASAPATDTSNPSGGQPAS
jgi:RND family efflux transporter MFP subunit